VQSEHCVDILVVKHGGVKTLLGLKTLIWGDMVSSQAAVHICRLTAGTAAVQLCRLTAGAAAVQLCRLTAEIGRAHV
jgi:hypothetical protein